nr:hypothetical protein CFP56_28396 [Quercus suber]
MRERREAVGEREGLSSLDERVNRRLLHMAAVDSASVTSCRSEFAEMRERRGGGDERDAENGTLDYEKETGFLRLLLRIIRGHPCLFLRMRVLALAAYPELLGNHLGDTSLYDS